MYNMYNWEDFEVASSARTDNLTDHAPIDCWHPLTAPLLSVFGWLRSVFLSANVPVTWPDSYIPGLCYYSAKAGTEMLHIWKF